MAVSTVDVAKILQDSSQGLHGGYDSLVAMLINGEVKESELCDIIHQLKNCAGELSKEHRGLITGLLKIDWTSLPSRGVSDYQSFIVNLVASSMFHLRPCLRMIVLKFLPREPSEDRLVMTEDSMHPHRLLNTIIKLVPMSPTVLLPTLKDLLPVVFRPANQHESYIRHLLQIMTYLTPHRIEIFTMVMDHITKIDVYSPKTEIEETEGSDDEDEELFPMEGDLGPASQEADDKMKHSHANKLDILMEILFTYIHGNCYPNGELDWEATKNIYKELLQVFDRVILPTHACCHVQFSMFYICSFHVSLHEGFIDYLWKKVVNPNQQAVFRRVAVSYIASLVARAKYINLSVVIAVVELMTSWIHRYIRQCTDVASRRDVTHHGPFYSVCQALFYVLIYRNRELMSDPKGVECVQSANIQTIVTSRLNPLRFCLPVVTKTFCSVARQHQLAFCDTIIERNRRNALPIEGSSSGAVMNSNPLDSFFPFDPYILKRSSSFIEPLYQEYYGTPVAEEEEQVEDNTEDVVYRDDAAEDMMSSSYPKTPLSTSLDLMEYGVSPGFKHT